FDRQIGHLSAPSFKLQLNGSSLAYRYEGRDIAVRTSSDYLLVAFVKSDAVREARAYLTAYYFDRKGRLIAGTERRSRLVGGSGKSTDWEPLTIGLPGNVPSSRYIGITVWLTQASVWDTQQRPKRAIELTDVDARMWIDDLTVYRLPRVTLRSASPGNVFTEK